MANFTPTKVDDTIVSFLEKLVEDDGMLDLFVYLVNLFAQKKETSMADVVAHLRTTGQLPPVA